MTESNPHHHAHRLAELLEQLADLPPSQRAHSLLAACPDNQPLREEALALAAVLDGAGSFLEALPRTHTPASNLTGRAVGPYLVSRCIGEGGMGTVYEAVDTRLERTVAIKTLSSAVGDHIAVAARLSREARALAQLNHPGIAAIYGVEPYHAAPGGVVLILEFARGITLAQRLRQGPVSREETLRIAAAIAEALEAAHARGIIHRDLKPSNIMLDAATGEIAVKVLDFGLAKAIHGLASPNDPLTPPTATPATSPESPGSRTPPTPFTRLAPTSPPTPVSHGTSTPTLEQMPVDVTAAGEIMGTAAYMSPEQARAAAVDRRTDIWALGCIIFEMLAGRRLFDRGSSAATLAAVLAEPPPLSALPEGLPPTLTLLLNRCLRKDPRDRLRDAGDVRLLLMEAIGELNAPAVTPRRTGQRPFMHGAIAALALGSGFALALAFFPRSPAVPAAKDPVTFEVTMSPTPIPLDESNPIALSPDGRLVVAAVGEDESARLTLRRLNEASAAEIPGTEHGGSPFFSPDGQWIGFVDTDRGALRKIGRDGGPSVTIGAVSAYAQSPVWLADDRILFSVRWNAGLHAWNPRSKTSEPLPFTPPFDSLVVRPSALLPDGITLLATICSTSTSARQVEALNTNSLRRTLIVDDASDAFLIGPGELAFVRNGTLLCAHFDPVRLALTGPETPIA
ncbi:MAG: protein kinase, partial [Planctomycetota bacterium]|nr:protein kinase [Planctomycetota bacterium]